jgi:hypothetical protein
MAYITTYISNQETSSYRDGTMHLDQDMDINEEKSYGI